MVVKKDKVTEEDKDDYLTATAQRAQLCVARIRIRTHFAPGRERIMLRSRHVFRLYMHIHPCISTVLQTTVLDPVTLPCSAHSLTPPPHS